MKSAIPISDRGAHSKSQVIQGWRTIPLQWRFLIVVCLVAGIAFRVVNLDGKVYWNDETYTSLRVSGYTEAQAVQHLSNAGLVGATDFQRYQFPTNPDKSVIDTLKGLAAEEPQLTPLQFVLARFWAEWFGNSVAVIRSVSVIAGLLALPCMWWLCLELFESHLAAWMGTALLAVSPFQVVYAQEARPYAWWALTILLSSATLLRAMRVKTKASWLFYTLSLATSFYAFLFSALVAIAHAIYVFAIERFRFSKTVIAFAVSLCLSTLAFLPWLLVVALNASQANHATAWSHQGRYSLVELYKVWATHIVRTFLDLNTFENLRSLIHIPPSPIYWIVRLLVVYAFYLLCRRASQRIWLFVVTLTGIPALALILPDLILGGERSGLARYIVPVSLGFLLAVTYLLSEQLSTSMTVTHWRRIPWRVATVFIISIGFVSCALTAPAQATWNKIIDINNPKIAQIINQAERPLVISDADLGDLLSLSYHLDPKVRLLVRPQSILCNVNLEFVETPYLPEIPKGFSDVFLYKFRPRELWSNRLKQQQTYQLKEIFRGADNNGLPELLWKIKV